jgi:hypothetical protein
MVLMAAVGLSVAVQERAHSSEPRQSRPLATSATAAAAPSPSAADSTTSAPPTTTSAAPTPFHHAHPPWTIPTFAHLSTPLFSPADQAALYRASVTAANCMWDHGIPDFPEPNPHYGDGHTHAPVLWGPPGSDLDTTSTAFTQALAACRTLDHAANMAHEKAYDDQPSSQPAR